MIVLSRDLLSEMSVDAIICPIMGDFCFESRYSRQVKNKLKDTLDFSNHQRNLIMKNLKEGEFFFFPLEGATPFSNVYYFVIQNFFRKSSFRDLLNGLKGIFLHATDHSITSLSIPFLSLGIFGEEIDLEIFKEALLRAIEVKPEVEKLKIVIPETKEKFSLIIRELASLPQNIFRADRFGIK